ncbi:hypothetical protein RchiOBHm_Chr2g0086251 [Rosa chinensis]|uniref:Uncharacterized protein n=2 Tax=Rosa chinensis TaxID=74649 RepID=A0A2P6RID8_ROSCH|nr:hypothetical protein RchiOBHm_Chr2g0086251 [Rosa chinensis]
MPTLCRRDVEPEIVGLSSKDIEQSNISDDDFIDDNPLQEELLSGDEDNTRESDGYSDLD